MKVGSGNVCLLSRRFYQEAYQEPSQTSTMELFCIGRCSTKFNYTSAYYTSATCK